MKFGKTWPGITRELLVGVAAEAAEEWIDRLETIFQAVTCNEYQKARVAILLLTEEAKRWWRSAGGVNDKWTTWSEFKEKFFEHYFPPAVRHEKEVAFHELAQGNMHEDEFIATFTELSRYVTYLQYRDDPYWKHLQLIQKARSDLRPFLLARPFVSFEDTCNYMCVLARSQRSSTAGGLESRQNKSSNYLGPSGGVNKNFSAGSSSSGGYGKKSQGQGHSQGHFQRGGWRQ